MPVSVDGKKLIPAPFVTISRETVQREDGKSLGPAYQITVRGRLVAWKGSPDSSGAFWTGSGYPPDESVAADSRLTVVLKKQQALRQLFSEDGLSFEVSGFDGFAPFKCRPKVKRVEFPEGEGRGANWTEYCEYVVTLEADCVHGVTGDDCPADSARVSRFGEEWNLELLDEAKQTYRLTRSLSAAGRRVFDETGALADGREAWENARDYLVGTVGLGLKPARMASSGVLDADTLQAFNYVRSEGVTETAGLCSVTESWVCFDPQGEPPATHERTITARTSAQDGRVTVSVEGTIQGLEERDNSSRVLQTTRYANAAEKWEDHVFPALHDAAQDGLAGLSEATLNPLPAQASVGRNEAAGTVSYQYEFDNRPSCLTPGALSEVVTVQNSHPADVFAQVPVLGRPLGPVLQGTGTVTARKRNVGIEIQMPAATTTTSMAAPSTDAVVLALMPAGTVYLEQDEETWVPTTGRYNRSTSFVYE